MVLVKYNSVGAVDYVHLTPEEENVLGLKILVDAVLDFFGNNTRHSWDITGRIYRMLGMEEKAKAARMLKAIENEHCIELGSYIHETD